MSVRVKMKTLILAISTLFCVAYLHAQTNYYATTKTFNQDGYIYQCDVRASGFIIKAINGLKFILFIKVQVNLLHKQMQALNCLKMIIGLVLNVNLL